MENRSPSVVFLISYPEEDPQSHGFAMKVTFFLIVVFLIAAPRVTFLLHAILVHVPSRFTFHVSRFTFQ